MAKDKIVDFGPFKVPTKTEAGDAIVNTLNKTSFEYRFQGRFVDISRTETLTWNGSGQSKLGGNRNLDLDCTNEAVSNMLNAASKILRPGAG